MRKIALANPLTAPYGRAAQAALAHAGLTREAAAKLVVGENISQTAQFVETGSAEAGFVALSLVLSPRLKSVGTWREIPAAADHAQRLMDGERQAFSPMLAILSAQHEVQYSRLFRS